jgi:hypothetical protein
VSFSQLGIKLQHMRLNTRAPSIRPMTGDVRTWCGGLTIQ